MHRIERQRHVCDMSNSRTVELSSIKCKCHANRLRAAYSALTITLWLNEASAFGENDEPLDGDSADSWLWMWMHTAGGGQNRTHAVNLQKYYFYTIYSFATFLGDNNVKNVARFSRSLINFDSKHEAVHGNYSKTHHNRNIVLWVQVLVNCNDIDVGLEL